jgi:hypothetical protein
MKMDNDLGDDDILEKNVVEQFYNHLSKFEKKNVIWFSTVKIDEFEILFHQYFNPIEDSNRFSFRDARSSLVSMF